ncbi:WW domain-binding protein 11, putative [Plasmodium reichenowi]|uniref:WW domain-binding protein 11, putative n=1 Tax=Plasmodium reichenowi TaxID=5854 RepID=A0A151L4S6_PLARE|nr:WW domain-binding protein 11, putative [Plasmodium reichenowi]KYN93934.1 WW domain-binding protein 11, putative [Plasmodium reichenowi]
MNHHKLSKKHVKKSVLPTDAYRKQQKKKEKKKKKKEKALQLENIISKKNPHKVKEKLDYLRTKEKQGKLLPVEKNKLKEYENLWNLIKEKVKNNEYVYNNNGYIFNLNEENKNEEISNSEKKSVSSKDDINISSSLYSSSDDDEDTDDDLKEIQNDDGKKEDDDFFLESLPSLPKGLPKEVIKLIENSKLPQPDNIRKMMENMYQTYGTTQLPVQNHNILLNNYTYNQVYYNLQNYYNNANVYNNIYPTVPYNKNYEKNLKNESVKNDNTLLSYPNSYLINGENNVSMTNQNYYTNNSNINTNVNKNIINNNTNMNEKLNINKDNEKLYNIEKTHNNNINHDDNKNDDDDNKNNDDDNKNNDDDDNKNNDDDNKNDDDDNNNLCHDIINNDPFLKDKSKHKDIIQQASVSNDNPNFLKDKADINNSYNYMNYYYNYANNYINRNNYNLLNHGPYNPMYYYNYNNIKVNNQTTNLTNNNNSLISLYNHSNMNMMNYYGTNSNNGNVKNRGNFMRHKNIKGKDNHSDNNNKHNNNFNSHNNKTNYDLHTKKFINEEKNHKRNSINTKDEKQSSVQYFVPINLRLKNKLNDVCETKINTIDQRNKNVDENINIDQEYNKFIKEVNFN